MSDRYAIVDTNIILNCPQMLRTLLNDYDKVMIPRTVIRELNYQKDRGNNQNKKLASLCLGMIIELKGDKLEIREDKSSGTNNDDRIWECALRAAIENPDIAVTLISNDKDFKLKCRSRENLYTLSSKEYMAESKVTLDYDIKQSQAFFDAVKHRRMNVARQLTVQGNLNVNFVDMETGFTPLIQSIRNRDYKMVEWLLELSETDINAVDRKKYLLPPISHAVQINNDELVKMLIEHGANVNAPSQNKRNFYNTPLMIAAWSNREKLARILIENGACINQADKGNGFTALIKAVFNYSPDVVRYLLDQGADKTICSFEGMTALDYAYDKNVDGSYKQIIEMLGENRND